VSDVPTRNYQSIGEVLVSVKTEFPDITISKIRFLESEGLIDPERTPSGYRKFYEKDVDRLRSILRMQRDEYLPLKVIKDRLLALESVNGQEPIEAIEPSGEEPEEDLAEPPTGLQMSIEEMSAATGIDRDKIRELESFGLVCSHGPEAARYYDGDDYVVLSIVKDFFRYGVEPRHLTMYKHFEEREASFFETIVMPQLRQRNPDARRLATASLTDLAKASRKLKQALLRTNLRQHLS
jgi:DNA-binding transcriptional MerR regulator